ncbi:hypothetical protein NDU88_009718 [Pleurodeles waltl]|uniref:Uncharacterized protein n=1 Tax=Pleurodeles waltl TaxID=8319 RepID=A0AAV7RX17_PLEWA|nr:hypothetical protein NDU88_009718 [Pleurodeles waltl]
MARDGRHAETAAPMVWPTAEMPCPLQGDCGSARVLAASSHIMQDCFPGPQLLGWESAGLRDAFLYDLSHWL